MCGIAGVVGRSAVRHRRAVEVMLRAMEHRGPDGGGVWVARSGDCVLGHRRLAILDLSDSAAQPMVTGDERCALSYNGECYNYEELRRELECRGENRWGSSGDTEVVLRLLARDGADALRRLNGMFALALWDEEAGRLLLGRDRFGQKPLYWARFSDGLVFASEVRALLASGLVSRRMSQRGLLSFLCHGAVHGPDTIVDDVSLLPRATFLLATLGESPRLSSYWTPVCCQSGFSMTEVRDEVLHAVRRHLVSDVPVGVFLSGGVDSSIVAAAACATGSGVKTLSVTFPEHRNQCEGEIASRTARRLGTEHIEVAVSNQESLALAREAVASLDQPSVDGVNTFIVSRAARSAGLRVALSGLGGDELFGGYGSFREVPRLARWAPWGAFLSPLACLVSAVRPWDRRWAKCADALGAPPNLLQAYVTRRGMLGNRQVAKLLPGWHEERQSLGMPQESARQLQGLVRGLAPVDAVAQLELAVYMGQMLLRDSDVMGMANSLEIRVPFLDAELADLALALPPTVRCHRPRGKWLLIEAFRSHLCGDIIDGPKRGFGLPWNAWLAGDLKEFVSSRLETLAESLRPMSAESLRAVWLEFQRSPGSVGWSRPWALAVLGDYIDRHQLVHSDSDTEPHARLADGHAFDQRRVRNCRFNARVTPLARR